MRALVLMLSGVLLGCATPHQITDRSDYLAEGSRRYQNVTKEQVIAAAEKVLKVSDPQDFEFRYTADGFTGLRRYVIYVVIAATQGREKWEFTARPEGNVINAGISISEAGVSTGGYSTTPYEGAMNSVELYRLFWARVDYILGLRNDWVTCKDAEARLKQTNTNSQALAGLCGPTSNGRNAPPPPRETWNG